MPDDQVQFRSPTTGKVQAVPSENWDDALKQGYVPTTHKVMYSPDGTRGMVPNSDLKDYMKQGYQTSLPTPLEKGVTGEGISAKGFGTGAWNAIKGMVPSAPPGTTVNPLNPDFWTGKNLWGSGNTFGGLLNVDPSKGTAAQMGTEAATEYQRARAAGTNPLAAGYSAAISGAGPLVGVSDLAQQELAARGEGGQIIGQSAVPAALAALPFVSESLKGAGKAAGKAGRAATPKVGSVKKALLFGADVIQHPEQVPGRALKWAINKIPDATVPPEPGPLEGMTSTKEPIGNAQLPPVPKGEPTPFPPVQKLSDIKAAAKAEAKAAEAARKGGMTPPPFAGATSSAMPIGNAPLPEVPQGNPTPFPVVQPKVKAAAAGVEAPAAPNGESGIPTFGKTLYQMGEEPNLANPQHVKILKVLQTRSGPDLRALANQGDRFAAFVLRTMPRP